MKIKLLNDIPVESGHGCMTGRIFEVLEANDPTNGRTAGRIMWTVKGDSGEDVKIFGEEAKVLENDWVCEVCALAFSAPKRKDLECPECFSREVGIRYP